MCILQLSFIWHSDVIFTCLFYIKHTWKICDLANRRTKTPRNLVMVMPLTTCTVRTQIRLKLDRNHTHNHTDHSHPHPHQHPTPQRLLTEEPISSRADLALSTLVSSSLEQYQRTMWAQNSTAMPTVYTRGTSNTSEVTSIVATIPLLQYNPTSPRISSRYGYNKSTL